MWINDLDDNGDNLPAEDYCTCGAVLLTDDELENGLCDECADKPLALVVLAAPDPCNFIPDAA